MTVSIMVNRRIKIVGSAKLDCELCGKSKQQVVYNDSVESEWEDI